MNNLICVGIPIKDADIEILEKCLMKQTLPPGIFIADNCSKIPYKNANIVHNTDICQEQNFDFVYNNAPSSKYFMWASRGLLFDNNYIEECISFLQGNKDYTHCAGKGVVGGSNENDMNFESNNRYVRLFTYLFRVKKNAVMYGVSRRIFKKAMPTSIGADWAYMCRMCLLGKVKSLNTTHVYKDDIGGSSSRKKMVAKWGHKIFLETVSAYHISKYCTLETNDGWIKPFVFMFLNCKFLFNSIKRRVCV